MGRPEVLPDEDLRRAALNRNEFFRRDRERLREALQSLSREDYRERVRKFCDKWHVRGPGDLRLLEPAKVANLNRDESGACVTLEIDLLYSVDDIMETIRPLVEKAKNSDLALYKQELYSSFMDLYGTPHADANGSTIFGLFFQEDEEDAQGFIAANLPYRERSLQQIARYVRRDGEGRPDPALYRECFQVWDMRQEAPPRSWTQIKKALNLNSVQTARDRFDRAEKLIKDGVPGLPPFPVP